MNVIVFRFSSFGDVTLTIPVIRGVLKDNPEMQITIVSDRVHRALFFDIPRCSFHGVNLSDYRGFVGLLKLFRELKRLEKWDLVIDLHSVLRTWILDSLFRLSGYRVLSIDKGRKEKHALTRKRNKQQRQLKTTSNRYLDVFKQAGITGNITMDNAIHSNPKYHDNVSEFYESNNLIKEQQWIAIAPFSRHKQKEWPIEKMESLMKKLISTGDCRLFLFGAGPSETMKLEAISKKIDRTYNLAGRLSLEEEIVLLNDVDVMITMDSFNMHLASMCNVKVVSIWGGTHTYAGFGPSKSNEEFIVEISPEELSCRPCSVFGSKSCYRGDLACLNWITEEMVLSKVKKALDN